MVELKTRYDLAALLNERGLVGEGCEIGVAEGGFGFSILDRWPGKLYMVDSWAAPDPSRNQENIPLIEQERRYALVMKTASEKYDGRAKPIRQASALASTLFHDGSLDFVYLDADHSFGGIMSDLILWYPKLRSGGLFAGHDYLDGVVGGVSYGVQRGVDLFATESVRELFAAKELEVNIINEEWPSWFCWKP